MVYVKYFDILGVDTAQIPCIELQGVPNTATVGAVGLLGMDVTSEGREVYICTAVNGAIYTWQPLKDGKDGSCVVKAEVDSKGELILTLSDGNVINAGYVKGDPGKDGNDGKDGENGVSVSGAELNTDGELVISLSNGTTTNVGKVVGNDGVSIVKVEMNANYEVIITLSNDTVLNLGASPITLQGLLGTEPIGEYSERIYYDGEKFREGNPISFAGMTWEQIGKIVNSGLAEQKFKVGDERKLLLSTGDEVTVVVLGFNHDELADGSGNAGVTFGMKDLLPYSYKMSGKYSESNMHLSILPNLYNQLPEDLKPLIKTVRKEAASVGSVESVNCQLFLFSGKEVGYTNDSYADAGVIYDYYEQRANISPSPLIKYIAGSDTASAWWTRWRGVDGWYGVINADAHGSWGSTNATNSICFGFCI